MHPDPMSIADPSISEIGEESRPSPRPPSYKLDHHHHHHHHPINIDLLERNQSYYHHKKPSIWRHQFHGTPLVFWLMFFVLIGTISLFIPQLPPLALILWLPLLLYFIGILLVHGIYSRKTRALHQMECQLATIQHQRSFHNPEYNELYFLRSTSHQHAHAFTTLLPPPPAYQRVIQ